MKIYIEVWYNIKLSNIRDTKVVYVNMRRLTAFICSLMIFIGIGTSFQVNAAYTNDEIKSDILSAIDWTNSAAKPLNNIGSIGADLTVIAMSRAGLNYDYNSYLAGLEKKAVEFTQATDVSEIQRTALAVLASGGDSEYIGDKDIVSLSSYYRSDEVPLGAGGVDDFSGALITLNSGDFKTPAGWSRYTRDELIRSILSYQESNGSFGDTEKTAAAIIALAPYNNSVEYIISDNGTSKSMSCGNAIWNAVNYLSDVQSGEGEFYSLKATALVSMAMDSIGVDDERLIKNKNTVMDGLLTYRNADGGFSEDYNQSDKTATGYALCALVSHLRKDNDLGSFFNFKKGGDLGLNPAQATVTQRPGTTTARVTPAPAARTTARAAATIRPSSATIRPAATPKVKTTPKASPKASPTFIPTPTPKPTERPALVGPAVPVGPQIPQTPDPMLDNEKKSISKAAPIVASVLALLALAGICCIYMMKKKIGIFKPAPDNEIYKAKQHRRTEEHRNFEKRMKINDRERYRHSKR